MKCCLPKTQTSCFPFLDPTKNEKVRNGKPNSSEGNHFTYYSFCTINRHSPDDRLANSGDQLGNSGDQTVFPMMSQQCKDDRTVMQTINQSIRRSVSISNEQTVFQTISGQFRRTARISESVDNSDDQKIFQNQLAIR